MNSKNKKKPWRVLNKRKLDTLLRGKIAGIHQAILKHTILFQAFLNIVFLLVNQGQKRRKGA